MRSMTIGAVLTLVACHAGAPSEPTSPPPSVDGGDLTSPPNSPDLGRSSYPLPDLQTAVRDLSEPGCSIPWTDPIHPGPFVVRSAAQKDAYGRNADDGTPAYARCSLNAPGTKIATDLAVRVFLDISLQDAPHGEAGAVIFIEISIHEAGGGRVEWTGPSGGTYAPGHYEIAGMAAGAIEAPVVLIDVGYANTDDPQSAALVQVQLGEIRSRVPCSP